MALNDKVLGYIRTIVPYGIGALLAWLLTTTGLDLTGEFQLGLVAFAVVVVTNMYYFVVRLLEVKFPWVGALLGFPKAPDYAAVDNLWASFVRTAIPTLVGGVLAIVFVWVASAFGLVINPETQTGIIVIIVAAAETGYYALARAIVAKWPQANILLGTSMQPVYPAPAGAAVSP